MSLQVNAVIADTNVETYPPQPLSQAIERLAVRHKLNIVAPADLIADVFTAAVTDEHEPAELLRLMLRKTCLKLTEINANTYALQQAKCTDTTSAIHQQPQPKIEEPLGIEQLLVRAPKITGSRLRTPAFADAAPLTVITRPQIELMGFQSLAELLRYLPSVSGNATSTLVSNGGNGTADVTLRGLPASNTLVLINGRRFAPEAFAGAAIDLQTLPLAQVERVDVFSDGASAIYGSDAVAGVVNIITRKQVNGLSVTGYGGLATAGDLETQRAAVVYGRSGTKGQFSLGASWYNQGAINSRDRSLSRSSDDRPRGGIDKRSSATIPGRVQVGDATLTLANPSLVGPYTTDDFRLVTTEDRFEFRRYTSSIVPSKRWSLFGNADVDVRGTTLFAELQLSSNRAQSKLAPTPLFTGFETDPITLAATAVLNPFATELTDVRRRFVELGAREQSNQSRATRLVLGWRGEQGPWRWQLSGLHSTNKATESLHNLLQLDRIVQALGDNCQAPCTPLELFGGPGTITPQQLEYLGTNIRNRAQSRLDSASAQLDFAPILSSRHWLRDLELSTGVEFRKEVLRVTPDTQVRLSNTIGGSNFGASRGNRDILESYAELYLPLWRSKSNRPVLAVQVAGRASSYSDFDTEFLPRYVLLASPIPELTLRLTAAKGLRVPSLKQLFASPSQSFAALADPCSVPTNVGVLPGCTLLADASLNQILTTTGGDAALLPEKTDSYSLAIAWEATKRLKLSANVYRLSQRNVVDSSEQFIVNQNAQSLAFAERVQRDQQGNLTSLRATLLNLGRRQVRGFDLASRYTGKQNRFGRLTLALNATRILEFEDQLNPDLPKLDQAGTFTDQASDGNGALPHWKANLGMTWERDRWQLYYSYYWVSSLTEVVPLLEQRRRINSWHTQNLQLNHQGPLTAFSKVTLGVNNLLNNPPPFSAAAFNDSYDARTYDITGRYVYLRWSNTW